MQNAILYVVVTLLMSGVLVGFGLPFIVVAWLTWRLTDEARERHQHEPRRDERDEGGDRRHRLAAHEPQVYRQRSAVGVVGRREDQVWGIGSSSSPRPGRRRDRGF